MKPASLTTNRSTAINFILNDVEIVLSEFEPDLLLLDYLREKKRLTGTKEGCAEGDCGACTVLVGRINNGTLEYSSVNACIRFMATLDAKHVITIEGLANGALKPLQDAMVKYHGSQCGFCTPGIMMSLFALFMENAQPSAEDIEIALQGNLCRCTGYEPIVKAALSLIGDKTCAKWLHVQREKLTGRLTSISHENSIEIFKNGKTAFIPKSEHDLANYIHNNTNAMLVAGATDVGLWVTKHFRDIHPAIFMSDVQTLDIIDVENGLTIGANISYSKSLDYLAEYHSAFRPFIQRIGGTQIRNAGTIGGNIANGSPIGDMAPALIALNATLSLKSVRGRRQIPLEAFFIEYGKQDLKADEFVESVHIPPLSHFNKVGFYKISKRRDEDISTVMVAFNLDIRDGVVKAARIALGGMAGTPKRAICSERFLIGKNMSEANMEEASQKLSEDFIPLSDWRASAEYRMIVAQNLFVKFAIDVQCEARLDAA